MGSGACLDEGAAAAFAEARLPPASIEEVAAHLRACAGCQERVAEVMTASRATRTAVTEILGPAPTTGESGTEPLGRPRRPRPTRAPTLEAGVSIGRYTVLGLVGRGGMGEVYAAYDPSLDRKVALKLMLAEVSAEDDFAQERLLREAQAIAKLSHPNVVIVHDVGTYVGRVFVAMEFVEGTTLAAWLDEKERPWHEVFGAFMQAARGLAAAHRAGIVHRDFKPQNVMVGVDGAVRVMDFGLALRIGQRAPGSTVASLSPTSEGSLTRTGEQLGTPLYMAPEQFAAGTIDARTDQFSFCVAFFWALTGAHPFGAGSVAAAGATPAAPKARRAPPPALQRALTRGLSADPSGRWGSMDELCAALSRGSARRGPLAAAVVGVIVACIALGVGATRIIEGRSVVCAGGADRLAGVWELGPAGQRAGSRREAVRASILKAEVTAGGALWARVSTMLDRRMSSWLVAYREACEATNVRHDQSPEVLDLRMACLNDGLDSTRALTDLLSGGEARVIEGAADSAASLERFEHCADVQQLLTGIKPPKDPSIRARVDEARKRVRDASALFAAGQYGEASQVAAATVEVARKLHYCPLEAEAMVVQGDADLMSAEARGAETLEAAILIAESCGHDRVVARAATELVWAYVPKEEKLAERSAAMARAALQRVGGDARLEGWLANNVGVLRRFQGRLDEALAEEQRAVELKTKLLGPEHLDVGLSMANLSYVLLDLGRPAEALAMMDRVCEMDRRQSNLPAMLKAMALGTRAMSLAGVGRLDEAEEAFRESLKEFEALGEENGRGVTADDAGLGAVLVARERPREAVPYLENALRLAAGDSPFEIAENRFALARARDALSVRDPEATKLARQAEATFATQPAYERRRREVAAWLEARQPARRAARSSAARKLSGRATPVPAMSNAVP